MATKNGENQPPIKISPWSIAGSAYASVFGDFGWFLRTAWALYRRRKRENQAEIRGEFGASSTALPATAPPVTAPPVTAKVAQRFHGSRVKRGMTV